MQALGEAGVRGFSRPGVESSSLYDNTVGAVFPQPAEFFLYFPVMSLLFPIGKGHLNIIQSKNHRLCASLKIQVT